MVTANTHISDFSVVISVFIKGGVRSYIMVTYSTYYMWVVR